MPELESIIEQKLIDQLCCDESQWTYRGDITTEEDLWANFKYILEQNNKAVLNDELLSDSEFAKIKNDVSHSSFYEAGTWLVGENGKVQVHVQRGNETLHLTVMNNEHIAGGTSVYQVINQYRAFKEDEDSRDRRFDVTLLINGIPLIHVELKNKSHSYMEGFNQIRKYVKEGKFHGLFSNVQMFVVSNSTDTKYFSSARDTELNREFLTGWLDEENQPVTDYLDFARAVLRIPEAHEMVTKYTVLDKDKKRLLILRPYQIHAIEAMRNASKHGESGYIWHTTGSGKTMTSYKSTRNLLMDIPAIEKTVFLIDRKDLDMQTKMAFQSYAENDTIVVDDTEDVDELIKRLSDGNRQMIVTTRQKLQIMIGKRLKEGSRQYERIRSLKVAFVVDECHRAVSPQTKRDIERFFGNSLWYGFTGTPIFEVNKYEQKGDLPQTTEQMYGRCLHHYTIKEAIHDNAVLGFMVENLGPVDVYPDQEEAIYESDAHMKRVLDVILNHSAEKFCTKNGRGRTYEAILTTGSIARAQKYYEMLKAIKEGRDEEVTISEEMLRVLPDFPKFAITYSLSENEESSTVNQDKMKESLDDYNMTFGTKYGIDTINAYNSNLNDRLSRKNPKYRDRSEQLDLVIVVDRLLTGFDAPCLSTIFIDREPMSPQGLIQAFSRTNRLYEAAKQYGQVTTFRYPKEFKQKIDEAIKLYSRGGTGDPIAEDWEDVLKSFLLSLRTLRGLAPNASDVAGLSQKGKRTFVMLFRALDHDYAHLKAFTRFSPDVLDGHAFSEEIYEDYAAMYRNVVAELKANNDDEVSDDPDRGPVWDDYELVAYSRFKVDFEYIVGLLQGFVDNLKSGAGDYDREHFDEEVENLRKIISEFSESNPKLSALLNRLLDDIVGDKDKYMGVNVSELLYRRRSEIVDKEIRSFSEKWYISFDDVKYEVMNFRDGEISNETKFKESTDYGTYKAQAVEPMPKFKFYKAMVEDFKNVLMPEIGDLLN
ncbi:MAG: type I restriction endonuclease subunit R [Lachnospiraceae bacterium]|nr:type I restriction endonuclease subunit R [Lachnospiraceae bacterium]MBQ8948092.1 type I restriction endonuclease subunit R [Lachnospiraceae bacterium]